MIKIEKNTKMEIQALSFSVLKSMEGKTLIDLSRDQYYFNEKPAAENDASLELAFSDDSCVTLFILGGGESVAANAEPIEILEAFKLEGNAHCSWKKISLSKDKHWSPLIGVRVKEVFCIYEEYIGVPANVLMGWKILFQSCGYLSFYNCGDTGRLLRDEMPPKEKGYNLSLVSINANI